MILCRFIFDKMTWQEFDGWCASRGVSPLKLSWNRFLNLTYYYLMRGRDEKGRKTVLDSIAQAEADYNMAQAKAKIQAAAKPVVEAAVEGAPKKRRGLPPRPVGWGDGMSTTQSQVIHRQLSSRSRKR